MVGIGLSLGAGVLGLYAGKSGDLNRFDAQVGIGATFKTKVAQDFLAQTCCGFYNYFLGYTLKCIGTPLFE